MAHFSVLALPRCVALLTLQEVAAQPEQPPAQPSSLDTLLHEPTFVAKEPPVIRLVNCSLAHVLTAPKAFVIVSSAAISRNRSPS